PGAAPRRRQVSSCRYQRRRGGPAGERETAGVTRTRHRPPIRLSWAGVGRLACSPGRSGVVPGVAFTDSGQALEELVSRLLTITLAIAIALAGLIATPDSTLASKKKKNKGPVDETPPAEFTCLF